MLAAVLLTLTNGGSSELRVDHGSKRRRILVADDDEDILQLLRKRLERRGFDVWTASTGQEALATARSVHPVAAILDWMIPELQGTRVCELIKEDPATAPIRVVLLTARAAERDISAGFDRGADEYLTKPFAMEELDAVLARLLDNEA